MSFLCWCQLSSSLLSERVRLWVQVCVRVCACVRGHRFNWVRMSRRTGGQECCQWCRSYTNYRSAPAELDGRWTSWDPTSLPGRAPSRDRHCQEKKLQKKNVNVFIFFAFSAKPLFCCVKFQNLQWKKQRLQIKMKLRAEIWKILHCITCTVPPIINIQDNEAAHCTALSSVQGEAVRGGH